MADDPDTSSAADPIALGAQLVSLWPRLASTTAQTSCRHLREIAGVDYSLIDYQGMLTAAGQFALAWWTDLPRSLAAQAQLGARISSLFERHCGGPQQSKTARPDADKRFLDKAWQEDPALALARDLYLSYAEWLLAQVHDCRALGDHDKQKLAFYTRQLLCALAPTNMPFINPQVRTTALKTHGESLVNGLKNLLRDLERGNGLFPITQNDPLAFAVGRNLATTPGKVVYRNDLMELIQYAPRTDTVFRTPLLFVPPWINKYYILDLQPENSLFRWLIEQGHTVFVISWANPGPDHAQKGFEHYLREGPLETIDVVRRSPARTKSTSAAFASAASWPSARSLICGPGAAFRSSRQPASISAPSAMPPFSSTKRSLRISKGTLSGRVSSRATT